MSNSQNERLAEQDRRRYNFLRMWQKRYAHMKARHDGRSTNHSNANGKGLMSREEFFAWCKDFENMQVFLLMYFEWAAGGFSLWLSPSIDRIDPKKGYTAGNIQWLPFAENCKKNNKDPLTHKQMGQHD